MWQTPGLVLLKKRVVMIIVKFRVQDYLQNLTRATELTIEAAFVEVCFLSKNASFALLFIFSE